MLSLLNPPLINLAFGVMVTAAPGTGETTLVDSKVDLAALAALFAALFDNPELGVNELAVAPELGVVSLVS